MLLPHSANKDSTPFWNSPQFFLGKSNLAPVLSRKIEATKFSQFCKHYRQNEYGDLLLYSIILLRTVSSVKQAKKRQKSMSKFYAVKEMPSDRIAKGQKPDKTDNSSYCKARSRLTEDSIKALLNQSGENLDSSSPESWLWHNRRVLITDGSTLSMPDTDENQQAYPQHGKQKKGLGIPSWEYR